MFFVKDVADQHPASAKPRPQGGSDAPEPVVVTTDSGLPDLAPPQTAIPEAWVDRARGLAVLLLVAGYALAGIIDSERGAQAPWMRVAYLGIFSFLVPLLFCLSGLFVAKRLKAGRRAFFTGMTQRLVKPYLIWSVVQFSVLTLLPTITSHPATAPFVPRLLALLWQPESQFWLLYALFFIELFMLIVVSRIAAYTGLAPWSRKSLSVFLVSVVALRLLSGLIDPYVTGAARLVIEICRYAPYFALGVVIGPVITKLAIFRRQSVLTTVAIAALWIGATYAASVGVAPWQRPDWLFNLKSNASHIVLVTALFAFIPAALLGMLAAALLCAASYLPAAGLFDYLGQNAGPVYLTHVLFAAGTRITLVHVFGDIDPTLLFIATAGAGLAGPLALSQLAKKLGISRPLAFI